MTRAACAGTLILALSSTAAAQEMTRPTAARDTAEPRTTPDCETLVRRHLERIESGFEAAEELNGAARSSLRASRTALQKARLDFVSADSDDDRTVAIERALRTVAGFSLDALPARSGGEVRAAIGSLKAVLALPSGSTSGPSSLFSAMEDRRTCRQPIIDRAQLLPQASVRAGSTSPELALQAATLFFSNRWRLYLRTTVPLTPAADENEDEPEDEEGAGADSATPVSDRVKNALLDPWGAPLYASIGYFRKVPARFLRGDANDREHGLFWDARLGLKFMDLTEAGQASLADTSQFTAFAVGSLSGRLILPMFAHPESQDHAGGVELSATLVAHQAADTSSALFDPGTGGGPAPLARRHLSLHLSMSLDIKEMANISIAGTPWSLDGLGGRFALALNLMSK